MNIPKSFMSKIQEYSQSDANKEFLDIKATIDDIFLQRASVLDFKKLYE